MVNPPFVVQALTYDCQCLLRLSTKFEVMGSPPVLNGARQCRPSGLDVTLVSFRSSGSEGLSERWMIVRRDEFSIGCFQISHDSYMPQLQKEQYKIVTHILCPEVRRK